jgi:protein-tyrosine-phosphatase
MNAETKHKLIWGWLRLFLGFLQMSFVAATVGAFFAVGPKPVTFTFLGLASVATAISLAIYRRAVGSKTKIYSAIGATAMSDVRRVLFLCTGNSARSIFGEYLLKRIGGDRFEAYSAGAQPTGVVNPFTIRVLEGYHIDTSQARSKSWEEFKDVEFDFVITVCDNARESCPFWPGQPIIAHWGIPDPALATGSDEDKYREFRNAALTIQRRLELFCSLPFERLDRLKLTKLTQDIGNRYEADGG